MAEPLSLTQAAADRVAAIAAKSPEAGDGALGVTSLLFYLAGYAAMNLAAFFAVIAITNRTDDDRIEGLAGLGRRSPWRWFFWLTLPS